MFGKRQNNADRRALEATTPQSNKVGPWWHDKGLRKLNILLFFPLLSEYTQGYDASIINNVQQLKRWQTGVYSPAMSLMAYVDMQFPDFNHPHGQILGLMSASYWVGNIVGVVFISSISERLGRRHSMMFGALLCILGTALATASVNQAMFIVGRFVLGLGGVVVGAVGPILMTELAYPTQRATATALSNTTYSAGAIMAAWITFGSFHLTSSWAWRLPSIFQGLPSVLQIFGIYLLPESPRWLISKGKEQKALSILAEYHGAGNPNDEIVQNEFTEIKETIEAEIAANKTSWKTLFSTRGNRWRAFIMIWCGVCKQWSGNGLVSYYLGSMLKASGVTSQLDTTLITATSQMFSFACSLGFAFLPSRYGRRSLMLISMGLMWLVFSLITITTGVYVETKSKSASYASIAFIYLYSGVHNIGWTGAMMLYLIEILPYSIRTKGVALFWLLTGAAGAFNTYVNPLGIDAFAWKFYFFYVAWITVEFVVVYLVFIETKGPSLEQIALLFDGKDASVSTVNPIAADIIEGEGEKESSQHVEVVGKD